MDVSHSTARSPRPHTGEIRSRYSPALYSHSSTYGYTEDRSSVRLVKTASTETSASLPPDHLEGHVSAGRTFSGDLEYPLELPQHREDISTQRLARKLKEGSLRSDRTIFPGSIKTKQDARLPSKFPLPRTRSHLSMGPRLSSRQSMPAWRDMRTKDIATSVQQRLSAQEAEEGRAVWTRAKWLLLFSVTLLLFYGLAGLLLALMTWFKTWQRADILVVVENDLLICITLAGSMCFVTALLGLTGTMLNSRPILAFYNLLLWPTMATILVVGYIPYKKQALNLDRKLNQAWSQFLDDAGRLRIQNNLHCCGYYNPLHEATFSKRCYPRTALPGCKGKLFRFEKHILERIATAAFSIVPIHLFNIFVGLLTSNHVNRTFGKGLMPRQYRLSMMDVRENAISVLRSLPQLPEAVAAHDGELSMLRDGHREPFRKEAVRSRRPSWDTASSVTMVSKGSSSNIASSGASSATAAASWEYRGRRRGPTRRNSVSTLASMPSGDPRSALRGLGLGVSNPAGIVGHAQLDRYHR